MIINVSLSLFRVNITTGAEAATAWGTLLEEVYHSEAGGWHDNTGIEWGWGLTASWVYGDGAPGGSLKTMNLSALADAWSNLIAAGKVVRTPPFVFTLFFI